MTSPPPAPPQRALSPAAAVLLTAGGLGHLRPAPGTWGSLPPVVIATLMAWLAGPEHRWAVDGALLLVGVIFAVACLRYGASAEAHWKTEDPSRVVADEVAGQALALLLLPWADVSATGGWRWNIVLAATAFLAFRVFDIAKPPPAHRIQRLPGGRGILADDLVAGVYALIATQVIAWFVLRDLIGPAL